MELNNKEKRKLVKDYGKFLRAHFPYSREPIGDLEFQITQQTKRKLAGASCDLSVQVRGSDPEFLAFTDEVEGYWDLMIARSDLYARLLSLLPVLEEGVRMFDVGSGLGELSMFLLREGIIAEGSFGVDGSNDQVTRANAIAQKLKLPIEYKYGLADILPVATESIEFLTGFQVYHWCRNWRGAFREVCRVLQVGGAFLIGCQVYHERVVIDLVEALAIFAQGGLIPSAAGWFGFDDCVQISGKKEKPQPGKIILLSGA